MSEFLGNKFSKINSPKRNLIVIFLLYSYSFTPVFSNSSFDDASDPKTASIIINEKALLEDLPPSSNPEKPKPTLESLKFSMPVNDNMILKKKYSKNPLSPHKGILIKTDSSKQIFPSLEGKVIAIDTIEGMDTVVILDHGNNIYSVYANLTSVFVSEGEFVVKKRSLGSINKLKDLYFQINSGSKSIDPTSLLKF